MTKTNENIIKFHGEALDLTQEAELTLLPDWNNGQPFTIRDMAANLIDMAEDAFQADRKLNVGRKAVAAKTVLSETIAAPVKTFMGNIATNIEVAVFDKWNGTNLAELKRNQARDERILAMAGKIHLLDVEPCAKHRKALASVRTMR